MFALKMDLLPFVLWLSHSHTRIEQHIVGLEDSLSSIVTVALTMMDTDCAFVYFTPAMMDTSTYIG